MAMRKRAKFNLSNFHNCTLKLGQLYPVHLQEVLPGDSVQMSTSVFLRFAPMVAPVMHPTHMFVHSFFVPSRLIANFLSIPMIEVGTVSPVVNNGRFDFESFITGGSTGTDSQVIPQVSLSATSAPVGSLADAFGIPVQNLKSGASLKISALPFAAYYMIWNEYYRDQDLQFPYFLYTSVEGGSFNLYHEDSPVSSFPLLQPCWTKDYFTTARPWPQKGPQVTIPVESGSGGITGNVTLNITGVPKFALSGGSTSSPLPTGDWDARLNVSRNSGSSTDGTATLVGHYSGNEAGENINSPLSWADPGLSASFDSTTPGGIGSINISDFREAMALQRFEEHRSMFGSRYEDYLRYLGVRPQDARLQLPEYLGGFTSPVQFSEVLQTSAGENGGVGDLYGHGISAARGRRIRRFIPEHGYIMSLMCVRPIPVYSQGIERLWSKKTKEDFWQRELQHIGQQEVLNSEVYADGSDEDANTFGFQNRYDEYRRGVNIVTGEFRTNQDFWTLARIFDNRPALNSDFVECNPSDRIFQVGEQNSDQLYCMVKNNVIAKRLVDKNGNPM